MPVWVDALGLGAGQLPAPRVALPRHHAWQRTAQPFGLSTEDILSSGTPRHPSLVVTFPCSRGDGTAARLGDRSGSSRLSSCCTLPYESWRAIRTPHAPSLKVHTANVGLRQTSAGTHWEPGEWGAAVQEWLCPMPREFLTVTRGGKTRFGRSVASAWTTVAG